ncbi:MAG: hypothetical protein M5U01_21880 [Ardenticatenaceae bacterium]|nr:hypothetical protein [Ardenticatenaceae bacterium]HBY97734.1 hypothetical protein [Chloroflexota bacterium]
MTVGEWAPWEAGEWLTLPVHQVLARCPDRDPAEFEFFLNEVSNSVWRFRRNQGIMRPVEQLTLHTPDGNPFVAPEIQLAYKARPRRPPEGRPTHRQELQCPQS